MRAVAEVGAIRVAALGVGFLCTTFTLRMILQAEGAEVLGLVSLLSTLVALVPFADLGLGTALTNMAARTSPVGDDGRLWLAIKIAVGVILIVGILITSFAMCLVTLGPDMSRLNTLGDPGSFLPVLSAVFSLWLLSGPAFRVLYGLRATATVIVLQASAAPLNVLATIVIIESSAPAWTLAAAPIACAAVMGVPAWAVVLRRVNRTRQRSVRRRSVLRSMAREGVAGVVLMFGAALLLQSDRAVLMVFDETQALATFAVVLPVWGAFQSILSAIGAYLWPHYAAALFDGNMTLTVLRRDWRVAGIAGIVMAACAAIVIPPYLWLVGYAEDARGATIALVGLIFLQSVALVPSAILSDSSLVAKQAQVSVVAGSLKVAIACGLVGVLGWANPAVATCVVVALVMIPAYGFIALNSIGETDGTGKGRLEVPRHRAGRTPSI